MGRVGACGWYTPLIVFPGLTSGFSPRRPGITVSPGVFRAPCRKGTLGTAD
jgi:hypothetical protein